jgi:hypothetical protein
LSDPEVIALVTREFVPVWIDIRTSSIPDLLCMERVLGGVEVDADGIVQGSRNQGFFLRSVVLARDGLTLLNEQPTDSPLANLFSQGYFPYGQVKAQQYLPMLRRALDRDRAALQAP